MLKDGDLLHIVNDNDEKIGWRVEIPNPLKRQREEEVKEERELKRPKIDETLEKLLESLNCGVCLEILYKPISLTPCLHNFCGGCYSEWMRNNKDCPMC